ncbi:MAG: DUF805 domain-containing protein [Propionibacteriaceae bacterium]|jgi:uncharacterized membrane protein YhaH (DUF805 family)|nr:DUF805 domain-containing protein [Propionibacteriaceae bacterium]
MTDPSGYHPPQPAQPPSEPGSERWPPAGAADDAGARVWGPGSGQLDFQSDPAAAHPDQGYRPPPWPAADPYSAAPGPYSPEPSPAAYYAAPPAPAWPTYQAGPDPAAYPLSDPYRPGAEPYAQAYQPYTPPGYGALDPYQQGFAVRPRPQVGTWRAFRLLWKNGFTFSGRASLSEFWQTVLAHLLIGVALFFLIVLTVVADDGGAAAETTAIGALLFALGYSLACAVPGIALTVRRLHDADLSGGFWFLNLVPFGSIALLVMLTQPSKPGGARYDNPEQWPLED